VLVEDREDTALLGEAPADGAPYRPASTGDDRVFPRKPAHRWILPISRGVVQKPLGDHLVLNLRRSLENPKQARVPPEPLRGVLARVAITAEDLHRLARRALGHLRREDLGVARLEIAPPAFVLGYRRVVRQRPRRL